MKLIPATGANPKVNFLSQLLSNGAAITPKRFHRGRGSAVTPLPGSGTGRGGGSTRPVMNTVHPNEDTSHLTVSHGGAGKEPRPPAPLLRTARRTRPQSAAAPQRPHPTLWVRNRSPQARAPQGPATACGGAWLRAAPPPFPRAPRLTEKPAQKGHEWRTRAEVVSARAAKLTATMRQPSTICVTPRASMARDRARCSRKRDRLRDSAVGLRERAPPGGRAAPPPPTGILRWAPHGAAGRHRLLLPPRARRGGRAPRGSRARALEGGGQPRHMEAQSCFAAWGDPRAAGRRAAAGGQGRAERQRGSRHSRPRSPLQGGAGGCGVAAHGRGSPLAAGGGGPGSGVAGWAHAG